jgi:3'-phosphoadenosine 5'-phosphosulfate sulfotransferase (PAPS reductase)/FAD synthetase
VIAVVSIIWLSLFLSSSDEKPLSTSLTLTDTGSIYLNNEQISYQLLADSRLSFIGCWLVMIPNVPLHTLRNKVAKTIPKQLFIFRDSINEQDFSRITRVIKQLE